MTFPWLTFLGLLPLVGGLLLLLPMGRGAARIIGIGVALATLAAGITVAGLYAGGVDLSVKVPWIRAFGAWWSLGLDGMGLAMVLMTVILTPVVLIAEWNAPSGRWGAQAFFGLVLVLEGLSVFVFTATDVLLFYLFFEATLIPMYFLIAGYGGERRGYAAVKFLLFSLAGGLIMLASVVGLFVVGADQGSPSYLIADVAALLGEEVPRGVDDREVRAAVRGGEERADPGGGVEGGVPARLAAGSDEVGVADVHQAHRGCRRRGHRLGCQAVSRSSRCSNAMASRRGRRRRRARASRPATSWRSATRATS